LKLAEVPQIREFCESRDACEKFTALMIVVPVPTVCVKCLGRDNNAVNQLI